MTCASGERAVQTLLSSMTIVIDRDAFGCSIAAVAKETISTSEAPGGFAGYSQAIRVNGSTRRTSPA
jgi:hypothetical protein